MTGRYLTLVCWLRGHDEPLWTCRASGSGWTCPTCLRFRLSRVLSQVTR